MIEPDTESSPSSLAGMLSDYRFCAYRLDVLRGNPNADRASIEAVTVRMRGLAGACREMKLPGVVSVYTVETDPNSTGFERHPWSWPE